MVILGGELDPRKTCAGTAPLGVLVVDGRRGCSLSAASRKVPTRARVDRSTRLPRPAPPPFSERVRRAFTAFGAYPVTSSRLSAAATEEEEDDDDDDLLGMLLAFPW